MQMQYAQSNSGSAQSINGAWVDFLSLNITTAAGSVVELSAVVSANKTGTGNIFAKILWDETQVAENTISIAGGWAGSMAFRAIIPAATAGVHVVKLQVRDNTSGGNVGGAGNSSSLVAIEY